MAQRLHVISIPGDEPESQEKKQALNSDRLLGTGAKQCPFDPLNDSSGPSQPWKGRAYTCAPRSDSATHPTSIRFSFSTISAMTFPRTTWLGSPVPPTAGLKPSRTC